MHLKAAMQTQYQCLAKMLLWVNPHSKAAITSSMLTTM